MSDPLSEETRWAQIRERLDEFERRLAVGFAGNASEHEARMLERTRQWATVVEEEQPDGWLEVLTFNLSSEVYAIESTYVSQVLPLARFTPLPGTPPYVLGIVNVRGRIVSVLDLRVLFEMPIGGLSDKNFLAILEGHDMEFGLLIDRVLGVTRIRREAVQPELGNLSGIREAYLLGVTAEQWTVLDGERLLSDPNLRIRDDG